MDVNKQTKSYPGRLLLNKTSIRSHGYQFPLYTLSRSLVFAGHPHSIASSFTLLCCLLSVTLIRQCDVDHLSIKRARSSFAAVPFRGLEVPAFQLTNTSDFIRHPKKDVDRIHLIERKKKKKKKKRG